MQKYYPEIYNDIKNQEYTRLGFLVKSSLKEGIETGLFRKILILTLSQDFI